MADILVETELSDQLSGINAGDPSRVDAQTARSSDGPTFDESYLRAFTRTIGEFLHTYYFRTRFIGFESMPERGNPNAPLLMASNHSGTAFPWDVILLITGLYRMNGYSLSRAARLLNQPALEQNHSLSPYWTPNFWKRLGSIEEDDTVTTRNFDSNMLLYPEGARGMSKGYEQRHHFGEFSDQLVRKALEYKTEIVPIYCINSEYLHPFGFSSERFTETIGKLGVSLPFATVGPLTPLLLAPWALHMGLPAKLTYVLGRPIRADELSPRQAREVSAEEIRVISERVRSGMQLEFEKAARDYGEDPYDWLELGEVWGGNLDKLLYMVPTGWPLMFAEFERLYLRGEAEMMRFHNTDFARALIRNPQASAYLLPVLGWSMIFRQNGPT